ncbi:MAG: hypothetical protein INR66_00215 [Gordonia polyisoprenivorans]|nr:hypothetical protein [Gordonia polyisoprenivorans]
MSPPAAGPVDSRRCEHCGAALPVLRAGRPRRYCSPACRTAGWARRRGGDPVAQVSVEAAVEVVANSPHATTEVLVRLAAQLRSGQRSGTANNALITALLGAYDAALGVVVEANPPGGDTDPGQRS